MTHDWTAQSILEIARGFQGSCVLVAAAELGVFDALASEPATAEDLTARLGADLRATSILADALTAMGLLAKRDGRYACAPGVKESLTEAAPDSVLAMVRHLANCQRSWSRLAEVVLTGRPPERPCSIRGKAGDLESFIEAMNDVSRSMAPSLVKAIGPPPVRHLLDVGGGPGTWTIEWLRAAPEATATLFDRPQVIPIARRHIAAAGLADRVTLAEGDLEADEPLPGGADLVWLSAIVHMNSRRRNRRLFGMIHAALADGGHILIRDCVMDPGRTTPAAGAMFAVNMLANTAGGGTFTFEELAEDLAAEGFGPAQWLHRGEGMDSVIRAPKA